MKRIFRRILILCLSLVPVAAVAFATKKALAENTQGKSDTRQDPSSHGGGSEG